MKKKIKTKKIKAYIVNGNAEIIEQYSDCGCQATFYQAVPIFKKKSDAESWRYASNGQKVIPCEIIYKENAN